MSCLRCRTYLHYLLLQVSVECLPCPLRDHTSPIFAKVVQRLTSVRLVRYTLLMLFPFYALYTNLPFLKPAPTGIAQQTLQHRELLERAGWPGAAEDWLSRRMNELLRKSEVSDWSNCDLLEGRGSVS